MAKVNNENLLDYLPFITSDWSVLVKLLLTIIVIILIAIAIYDSFIQRKNQLLINYPLIGRLRYFFYLLRNPMRQYFGDETFYDSFEKLDWINKVSSKVKMPISHFLRQTLMVIKKYFSNMPTLLKRLMKYKMSFSVTFGENRKEYLM